MVTLASTFAANFRYSNSAPLYADRNGATVLVHLQLREEVLSARPSDNPPAAVPVLSDISNSPPRRKLTPKQVKNQRQHQQRKARAAKEKAQVAEDTSKANAKKEALQLKNDVEDLRRILDEKDVQLIEKEKENRSIHADKERAENLLEKRTT